MDLRRIELSGYKNVDAAFDMAPLVVLFGPNNVGKTNVLEALQMALGASAPDRFDPTKGDPWVDYRATVVIDHDDTKARRGLIFALGVDALDWEKRGEWEGDIEEFGRSNLIDLEHTLGTAWQGVAEDAAALVRWALSSPWWSVSWTEIISLLPPPAERPKRIIRAAERVAEVAAATGEDFWAVRVARAIVDEAPQVGLWRSDAEDVQALVRETVHLYGATPEDHDRLLADIEDAILKQWDRLGSEDIGPPPQRGPQMTKTFPGRDPWLAPRGDLPGSYVIADEVHDGCRRISKLATELAPQFVQDHYAIEIRPSEPRDWRQLNNRRLRVWMTPHGSDHGSAQPLELMGSGSGLYASYAIREALAQLNTDPTGKVKPGRRYYLIDEPERHLHPVAQRQAAEWLVRLSRTNATVVLTTHSPVFLNLPTEAAEYYAVRSRSGRASTNRITHTMLRAVDEAGPEFGLSRSDTLQLLRGVLVVEGEHDLLVVKHFFEETLRNLRLKVLPLRGAKNTKRLVDSEFLGQAGKTLAVLLDNLRLQRVTDAESDEGLTEEERIAWSLLQQSERDDVKFLPYEEPDILCAVPLAAVGRRYPHLGPRVQNAGDGSGHWTKLIAEWREEIEQAGRRTSFKDWAAEYFDMSGGTKFVVEVLKVLDDSDVPSPALTAAMKTLGAVISDRTTLLRPL